MIRKIFYGEMHRACMGLRFLRACLWDREWIGGSAAGAEKSGFAVLLFFV